MNKRKYVHISVENKNIIEKYADYRLNSVKLSPETVKLDKQLLRKLAHFLNEKSFQETTKKDLQDFFKGVSKYSTYDAIGSKLLPFFRWLFDLEKKSTLF